MTNVARAKLGLVFMLVGVTVMIYAQFCRDDSQRPPVNERSSPPPPSESRSAPLAEPSSPPVLISDYRPLPGTFARPSPNRSRGAGSSAEPLPRIVLEGEATITGFDASIDSPFEICNGNSEALDKVIAISLDDFRSRPENQIHCATTGISDSRILLAPRWCLELDRNRTMSRWDSACRPIRERF